VDESLVIPVPKDRGLDFVAALFFKSVSSLFRRMRLYFFISSHLYIAE
jgi:hypothetical protein